MASTSETDKQHLDKTFRSSSWDPSKAAGYAAYRLPYPQTLIDIVIDLHTSTGGENGQLLDVGCGPGNSTRQLAPHFQHVIAVDPGQSMIETAQSDKMPPCISASGEPAQFKSCTAEDLSAVIPEPETVDIITAATSAHWFETPEFYRSASQVLKPGGSILMWCSGRTYPDPQNTPNVEEVRRVWDELEKALAPYTQKGNSTAQNLYRDMKMPWDILAADPKPDPSLKQALEMFDEQASQRLEFNADGQPDPDPRFAKTNGFLNYNTATLDIGTKMMGTASSVVRWREAHKEQLEKGEIEDVAEMYVNRLSRQALGGDRDWISGGSSMVVILIKKKKKEQP